MTNVSLRRAALVLALTTLLAACGKDEPPTPAPAADTSTPAAAPADAAVGRDAPAAPASNADEGPLAATDLEAYARGMQQELALLKAAGDKVAQARAKNDQQAEASAMAEMATMDTEVEGAKASGLSQARYLFVKNAIDGALGKAEMQAAMKSMGVDAADTSDLPPEQRQQIEAGRAEMEASLGDPHQGMAADVAEAFKARQAELAQLRAQAIAARFNAAR